MSDGPTRANPLLRAVAWIAFAIAVIFLIQTYQRAYRTSGNDFSTYLAASRAFWQGQSPYTLALEFPYVYPLLVAAALWPLTLVPYWLAVLIWFAVSVLSLVYAVWGTLAIAGLASGPGVRLQADHLEVRLKPDATDDLTARLKPGTSYVAAGLAVALHTGIIQNNLLNGQVNLIVLALMVAALRQSKVRHDLVAGALLGIGIAIKLTPLVLIPYFALRGRVRLVMAALAYAAFLCAAPALRLPNGLAHATDFLRGFTTDAFASPTFRAGQPLTFSIGGLLSSMAEWPPLIAAVAGILAVGLAVRAMEGLAASADAPDASVWAFAAYLVAIPLISPMSETHHLVMLIPAVALLIQAVLQRGLDALGFAMLAVLSVALIVAGQLMRSGIVYALAMATILAALAVGVGTTPVRRTVPS